MRSVPAALAGTKCKAQRALHFCKNTSGGLPAAAGVMPLSVGSLTNSQYSAGPDFIFQEVKVPVI